MRFSIVTPSFNQLDWLELCIASVRDQVATKVETGDLSSPEGQSEAAADHRGDLRSKRRWPTARLKRLKVEAIGGVAQWAFQENVMFCHWSTSVVVCGCFEKAEDFGFCSRTTTASRAERDGTSSPRWFEGGSAV